MNRPRAAWPSTKPRGRPDGREIELWFDEDGFDDRAETEADDLFAELWTEAATAGSRLPAASVGEPVTAGIGPPARDEEPAAGPRRGLPRSHRLVPLLVAAIVAVVVFVAVLGTASGHPRPGRTVTGMPQTDRGGSHVRTRTLDGSFFGGPAMQ